MLVEKKIKVILSKVYEYNLFKIYNILIDRGYQNISKDSLLIAAEEMALNDFVKDFVEEIENTLVSKNNTLLNVKSKIIDSARGDNTIYDDSYVLVRWPDVQDYMGEEWFDDEAALAPCNQFGSSAYFIPYYRINKEEDGE